MFNEGTTLDQFFDEAGSWVSYKLVDCKVYGRFKYGPRSGKIVYLEPDKVSLAKVISDLQTRYKRPSYELKYIMASYGLNHIKYDYYTSYNVKVTHPIMSFDLRR